VAKGGCSEDPDVKGTETGEEVGTGLEVFNSCSEDPDVKGTETLFSPTQALRAHLRRCSEDPDVKGTET